VYDKPRVRTACQAATMPGDPPVERPFDFYDAGVVIRTVRVPAARLAMLEKAGVDPTKTTWADLVRHGGMPSSHPDAPFVFQRWGLPGDGKTVMVMTAPVGALHPDSLFVIHGPSSMSTTPPVPPDTKPTVFLSKMGPPPPRPHPALPRRPACRNLLDDLE
jgi:hypothetical protein